MAVGIRTHDLRKIYTSAPPMAAGGFVARGAAKGSKQPKPQITALDGLSLEIPPGEIFGLLGPNGAGKSTTVGVLTTRVRPTSGQAWIGEHDVWKNQAEVKQGRRGRGVSPGSGLRPLGSGPAAPWHFHISIGIVRK